MKHEKVKCIKVSFFNYFAIRMLEQIDSQEPTQNEIDSTEKALKNMFRETMDCQSIKRTLRNWTKRRRFKKTNFDSMRSRREKSKIRLNTV